ncbi:unnamed protein product [Plutella xylostella]|uniref:(diamondback moth) hypothetical protein n=1 Tax=Plutella xylostella TaxID=51655 RepID=A0A8S4G5C2_PLUXY|nr:unnamed protein product [Plutella xylostella]
MLARGMARRVWAAALLALVTAAPPTQEPQTFEAAFQGRCGLGSPCEQLCLQLHDGTFECGCGAGYVLHVDGYGCLVSPCEQLCLQLHDGTFECGCGAGYVLHVDGYGCLELNATRPSDSTLATEEDVLYQKDVSISAALEPEAKKLPGVQPAKEVAVTEATEQPEEYVRTGERSKELDGLADLIEDGISRTDLNMISDSEDGLASEARRLATVTTLAPNLEQKMPTATVAPPWTAAADSCDCACDNRSCDCARAGKCKPASPISTPRFSGSSWLALRALRGAYKRVRVRIRVRPERARGVLLLTGEHDDLSGDYLALILRQGRVELRFDCGSGAGILRSPEPVRLGHWNTISVYRHRWDAWLRLNNGKRVRGRSKGLFSRMTFREPVWVGGAGNTTGLQSKLGLSEGLLGCVDFLRINGDTYRLVTDAAATYDIAECAPTLAPWKPSNEVTSETSPRHHSEEHHAVYDINDIVHFEDNDLVMRDPKTKDDRNVLDNSIEQFKHNLNFAPKSNDISKIQAISNRVKIKGGDDVEMELKGDEGKAMKTDRDDECACQHGGGCVAGVCLCPLGYAGSRCEITLDLKVPRFNGSSYLRLPGLGNSAQAWLDIQITLKPTSGDGLVLYDADRASGDGDFFSLHLRDYFVEFAFDLGSGIALVRSAHPLKPNAWSQISVTRSGRHATLTLHPSPPQSPHSPQSPQSETRSVRSRGAARRLQLRQPLLLGGAPEPLPARLALRESFSGCVAQLIINDETLSVVSAALGGVNVDNCDEPHNDSCTQCKEILDPVPQYPQNISETDAHHAIVPKKGFKPKPHKLKPKKHIQNLHTEKAKKKKFFASKKDAFYMKEAERSNDILTEGPAYDGQTYMQVKYLDTNEINWGDTNSYPSFMGTDSFIHIDDEETTKRLSSSSLDINIRFRALRPRGLLVWTGRARDYLALGIEHSVLVFSSSLHINIRFRLLVWTGRARDYLALGIEHSVLVFRCVLLWHCSYCTS